MARVLVLTVIGKDQPGLVEALADLIAQHGGSWDESRMVRLAGHFAGVVQIHIQEDLAEGLIASLPTLADRGLSVSVGDSDESLTVVDHRESLRAGFPAAGCVYRCGLPCVRRLGAACRRP